MKIEILLATMFRNNIDFIKKNNIAGDCVVVNQSDENSVSQIDKVKFINSLERGLSKSRNLAIKHSNADIGLVADDDIVYIDNYQQVVKDAYNLIPEADIIIFKLPDSFKKRAGTKSRFSKIKKLNFIDTLGIISFQISFKIRSIENIYFDERFGTGSGIISSGEENIFLNDCLNNNLKIYYYPKTILKKIEQVDSTWFKGFNKTYLEDRGAVYYRISKLFYPLLFLQFVLRRKKLFNGKFSFIQMIYIMNEGINKIK
jgi:hypothetical protein